MDVSRRFAVKGIVLASIFAAPIGVQIALSSPPQKVGSAFRKRKGDVGDLREGSQRNEGLRGVGEVVDFSVVHSRGSPR